ncbi:hypothetical protein F2Q69_00023319 [Brassica cretica]|uniref:Uncharacterized protein n=1 Tax=Brassica cretica TaxID=69181 RepID=A0A8S9QMW9_BRACR|nr:hypothetical protein F2Q69_00023319 [Brassica cretica]
MPTLETPNSGTGVNLPPTTPQEDASTRKKAKDAQTYDVEDSQSEPEPDTEAPKGATKAESPMVAYLEQIFSKRLDAMQPMVESLLGVAPPIRKSNPDSFADTPFTNEITLIEMPTNTPKGVTLSYHVQRVRLNPDRTRSAMTEPLRGYIARFNQEKVAIPECIIPTAISAFKRGMRPDRDLYKELTKYQCKTMEDVLSRAWAQVKWEEDVASRAKAQQKQDPKAIRLNRARRETLSNTS